MSGAKPSVRRTGELVELSDIMRRTSDRMEELGHFERVEERASAEAARDAARVKERHLRELLARGIPKRPARRIVAADYHETEPIRALSSLASELLVLGGPADGGKSFAAALAVANGPSASRFLHVRELSRLSVYRAEQMVPIETAPVLALDDLAVEFMDDKGMFQFVIDALLDARWSAELPTLITTNLNVEEFSERFGERIVSRLQDGTFIGCEPLFLRGG